MKARRDKKVNVTFQENHKSRAWDCLINSTLVLCYKMQIAEKGQSFVNKYVN